MFKHHTLISAMLLITGLVLFTLSLEKGYYRYQFKRLGWQIVCTLVTIPAGLFFGFYVFKGYFWVLMTNGSVMINDIMAYVFGKTMGRTKLIQLSPNKTVEGFVGGAVSTMLFAVFVSQYVSQFKQIICPQKEINLAPFAQVTCVAPDIYTQKYYDLPIGILGTTQVLMSPAQIHSIVIAIFAAFIAPFGGFLASGLKRGLKIKDFAASIPGHGGLADRFDCHIVCAFFVYIYLT
jgi:phosphatidate cytidylyltransferase